MGKGGVGGELEFDAALGDVGEIGFGLDEKLGGVGGVRGLGGIGGLPGGESVAEGGSLGGVMPGSMSTATRWEMPTATVSKFGRLSERRGLPMP